jgi:hypothetical protein
MTYRTKTYIAGDWTGDKDAIDQLYKWKESEYWSLDFNDAHEVTQSSDSSLNCSIKASLRDRLDISKTFVLVVGEKTKDLRSGECSYCFKNYECGSTSNKSFIEYECDKAVRDDLKIIVLYNAATADKTKCPDAVRYTGTHTPMKHIVYGIREWDYQAVKTALEQ